MKKILLITLLLVIVLGGYVIRSNSSDDTKNTNDDQNLQTQDVQDPNLNTQQTPNLSTDEVLAQPDKYIDTRITVSGKLYLETICPQEYPPTKPSACNSNAYLVGDSYSPTSGTSNKLPLFQNGVFISCVELERTCGSLDDGKLYKVSGKLTYFSVGEQITDTVILDVLTMNRI